MQLLRETELPGGYSVHRPPHAQVGVGVGVGAHRPPRRWLVERRQQSERRQPD